MSKTVDEKIVSMQFDNQHFEKNVQQTMSTLDKLKSALRLDGSARAVESEFASYKAGFLSFKDTMNKMWASWEQDLAFRAKNIAKEITTAFSTQAIKAGFSEYETQMGAVQTILSNTKSKGSTLEDVNSALDELNTYADKTIYNFTEMTKNIGTFTAAGVDLDTSVSAIKGIANLAAVSGSTSQQASTAMYQLSQAMASGTVKLMDWNSVVNAGMGGQVFQDALKETAKVHGVAIDDIIKKQGSFRESLSEGWLTTEILTETLSKFTGDLSEEQLKSMGYTAEQIKQIQELGKDANDAATKVKTFTQLWDTLKEAAQSGWSQTFRIIVGDFEEAKSMFTTVSDTLGEIIGKSAEARNDLLENWKILGGRDDLKESIANIFGGIVNIVKPIKEAFQEIFPPTTAEQLYNFTARIKELTEGFKNLFIEGSENSENLKRTFKGLFAAISIVAKVGGVVLKIAGKLASVVGKAIIKLLGVTGAVGDFVGGINEALEMSDLFSSILEGAYKIIDMVATAIGNLFKILQKSFVFKAISAAVEGFINILSGAKDKMDQMSQSAKDLKQAWLDSGLYKFLSGLWGVIKKIVGGLSNLFKGLVDSIGNAFGSGDFKSGFDIINGILSGGLLVGIGVFIKKLTDLFEAPKSIMESISEAFGNIGEAISNFGKKTSSVADNIKAIAIALVVLTASLVIISLMDTQKIANALTAIGFGIAEMIGAIFLVSKIGNLDGAYTALKSLTTIAIAMLVLSFAIKKLGELDADVLVKGVIGSTAGILAMAYAQKVLVQSTKGTDKKTVKKATTSLVAMSLAIRIIAGAIEKFGNMDWHVLAQGLGGVVICLAVMGTVQAVLMKTSKGLNEKQMQRITESYIAMSAALLIMSFAIEKIGKMPWDAWGKGMLGVVICLTTMGGVLVAMGHLMPKGWGPKKIEAAASSMLVLAASLLLLTPVLKTLGAMPWDAWGRAMLGVTALLVVMGGVMIAMSRLGGKGGDMLKAAGSIAIMAFGLNLIIPALVIIGLLPTNTLIQACVGLIAILASLAGAQIMMLRLASTGGQLLKAAGAIGIMAFGLNLIIPTLIAIGMLPFNVILQGIGSMIVVLAALAGAQIMLLKLAGTGGQLLMAAGSIAIMALGLALLVPPLILLGTVGLPVIGVGLLGLAGAFLVLGVAAGVFKALGLDITLTLMANALLKMSVAALIAGAGLVVIGKGLVAISAGLVALVGALVLIVGEIELLAIGLAKGLLAFFEVIIEGADVIAELCIALIKAACRAIIECVPEIVDTVLKLIVAVLESLAKFTPQIVSALMELITNIISALASKIPDLVKSVVDLLFKFVEGVVSALSGLDSSVLLEALTKVGMLAAVMMALAALPALTPGAMLGVLAFGAVITELALVLAAVGALTKIPGLEEFIEKGAGLLETIGNTIGRFIGGIIGGIAEGATSSLPKIGNDLSDFAKNSAEFFKIAATVTPDTLSGVKALADVILQITATNILDGLTRWFTGGSSIPKFSEDLVSLGNGLKQYATAVGAINTDGVDSASLNPEAITSSATAIKEIVEAMNQLPDSGGLKQLLKGSKNLGEFAKSLTPLGEGIRDYASSVGAISKDGVDTESINFDTITNTLKATKSLAEVMNSLPDTGGLSGWITGDKSLSSLGDSLVSYGENLSKFSTSVDASQAESIKSVGGSIKDIANGLKELSKVPSDTASKFADVLAGIIDSNTSKLKTASEEALKTYIDGLSGKKALGSIETAGKAVIDACTTAMDGGVSSFYDVGIDVVEGFANGISENSFKAEAKAKAMAQAAYEAAKEQLDVNSPSKIFRNLAYAIPEGMAVGIDKMSYLASDSAEIMANGSIDAVSDTISRIADVINSDIDANPTIRPVMDLSDVYAGASTVNGLLDENAMLGVTARVGAINKSMSGYSQNGANDQLASEIDKLGKSIKDMEHTTYSIGGITLEQSGEVEEAIKTILRYAKIERRT